jgi:two-component system, NarL family, sensor kinase
MKKFCLFVLFICCFVSSEIIGQDLYLKNLEILKKQAPSQKRDSAVVHNIFALTKIITPKMNFWIDSLKQFSTVNKSKIGLLLWQIVDAEKVIRTLNLQEGVKKHLAFAKQLEAMNYKVYASWSYLRAGIIFARPSSGFVNKKDALLYYEKGLEITIQAKDTNEIARAYDYIGEYYLDMKDYNKAIFYLEKSENLIEKFPNKYLFPTILASMGSCYLLLGNEKKADFYYKKMDFWLNKNGLQFLDFYQSYIMNIYYLGFANYYLQHQQYKKAIQFAEQGLSSIKFDSVKNKRSYDTYSLDHLKILHEANAKNKNYEKAYIYLQKYENVQNSHIGSEINENFQELNKKYQTEQKQIQITKLENESIKSEIKSQAIIRYFLIGFLGLLSVGFGFIFWSNRKIKAQNKEISEAMLKGQSIERQRVAIDLHDNLGSTLSSINWSLESIDKSKMSAEELEVHQNLKKRLEEAYNEVRLLSHNLLPEEFEKQGLVPSLEGFVKKLSKNKKMKFELEISENFGRLDKKIEFELYSISLELINNILKHSQASIAQIQLLKTEQKIQLKISDNGMGITDNQTVGVGLKNVEARIKSIKGHWKIEKNLPQGTQNVVEILL